MQLMQLGKLSTRRQLEQEILRKVLSKVLVGPSDSFRAYLLLQEWWSNSNQMKYSGRVDQILQAIDNNPYVHIFPGAFRHAV